MTRVVYWSASRAVRSIFWLCQKLTKHETINRVQTEEWGPLFQCWCGKHKASFKWQTLPAKLGDDYTIREFGEAEMTQAHDTRLHL